MVTRVDKFLGGLGKDVTNIANAHATENRIAFGASINPTANVHVVGDVLATTTITATGGFLVPNDGDVGSAGATDAIQISSGGIVTFKDDIKIKDDGTIGSASAATAMTIDSSGIVAFVDDIKIKDTGTIGSTSDPDAIAIGADGDVTFSQDLELQHDGATISFGGNDEIVLTHVHDTGLKLTDTGGSPTFQLHDANEAISSDGSKLILTTNGVALSLPTADGDDGEVLQTDGSGTLSFTAQTGGTTNPATTLASNHDCGSVAGGTTDAFNIATSALTELDLSTQAEKALGTVDQGALS